MPDQRSRQRLNRSVRFLRRLALALVLVGCTVPSASEPSTTSSSTATSQSAPEASPTTTTTTPPTITTTTSVVDAQPRCRPDPFADSVVDNLENRFRGRLISAHVYDTRTGCEYSLNPANRNRTASVFKVMVMAGTLLEAQDAQREVTEREMRLMAPMITRSTNNEVRILWRDFGGQDWFRQTADAFEMEDLDIVGDFNTRPWGRTRTSASDQVALLRQVLLGEWGPLEDEYRSVALDLMSSVVPEQTWGVTAGVPQEWSVAQKNGFAGGIVNSVGWVDEPGPSNGYVVAIMSEGSASISAGIPVVEAISEIIARAMLLPEPTGASGVE